MSYRLRVNNQFLDLFPNQEINIGADYYDTTNIDSIKIPFSFTSSVPYTDRNKTVLGYDDSFGFGTMPLAEYDYEVYSNGNVISSGKARIISAIINSPEPVFYLELKDRVSEFSKTIRELEISDIYDDAFSTQVRTLSTYLSLNQSYAQRDIEIPFIDFDNIQKTTGYESRQFTSWGTSGKKFGLMPALRVVDFIDRVFNAAGITYSSKFVSGDGSWDATNLYILYPTYLSGTPVSKRESYLFPFPYNVEKNSNQWDGAEVNVGAGVSVGISNYYLPLKESYEPFGPTNYAVDEAVVSREYGDQVRKSSGVTDWGDENVGYISYGSGFDAKFAFNAGTVTISGLKTCYATSEYIDVANDDAVIPAINKITSLGNALFTPYVLIYESYNSGSVPKYKIPMVDANGNQIQLTPTGFSDNTGIDIIPSGSANVDFGTISFPDFDARLDDTVPYELRGGSTYSCAISVEMVSGSITVDKYIKVLIGSSTLTASLEVQGFTFVEADAVKKRTFGYDWSVLGIKVDNHGSVPATCPSDNFQFKESLSNNKSIKVYDLLVDVMKRFGLSLVYDYTTGDVILDNLKDIRLTTSLFDTYIDSLKPYEVSSGALPPKTLKLLNKENDGLYDKFDNGLSVGSFDGVYNQDGTGEKTIEFITALINPFNKTVCTNEFFTDPVLLNSGLIALQEIGDIKNEFPDYDKTGLRIFYLKENDFQTSIRYPVFREYNDYGQRIRQILYKPVGTYYMQGYPVNSLTGNQKDLRFMFENGQTSDAYDYLVSTERFIANERNKMTFYAAMPDTMFQSGDIYKKKFRFNKSQENFIVNSLTDAKIYDGYVYGKFEVIFVD